MTSVIPQIQACNAFYYYDDLGGAYHFYRETLGFETVADYGFGKIMHVSQNSYLTLVDAKAGMHTVDEPKSVTLALVTDEVEAWYAYLQEAGVPMHRPYHYKKDRPHDGFVALDPEGYYLEFERFNPHPENKLLMPLLSTIQPTHPTAGLRPKDLGIQATVMWLYHRDLERMQNFYQNLLGVDLLVDQGWAKVYQVAGSGFIGLVSGEHGLHQATDKKCVTVAFFSDDVDQWFKRASTTEGFILRTTEVTDESGQVKIFVGYDPEGYFLEWDAFLDTPENKRLLDLLSRHQD